MAGTAIKRPWSAADARTLKSLARRTTAARSIAKQLRRTEGAIPPTIFGHMQLPLRLNDRSSHTGFRRAATITSESVIV
jgi:hypothetical protein